MKKTKFILSLAAIVLLSGCSSKNKDIDIDSMPTMQVPKQVAQPVSKKGSIYSRKGASLFADKKDLQVGDIIQILIEETMTNDSSASKALTKTNNTNLGGGLFSPVDTDVNRQNFANKLNGGVGIGFKSTSANTFKGSSSSSADEEFTTTISAIIEQTYQNGNYFIKGSKEMLINGQKQTIRISGVIRPYDISPENTVYSNQLANLKIKYVKDGDEQEALEKPWGSEFLESIWPF